MLFPRLSALVGKQPLEFGPVTLTARRIYILPTREGLLFAVFLLAMLAGSINYGLSLGFALVFLLVGVGLSAMVETWANLRGLSLTPLAATPAFAGERARFHFLLSADEPRRGIRIAQHRGDAAFEVDVTVSAPATLAISAERRGRLRCGRLVVSTVWPLGLFRAWAFIEPELSVLVYPRPAPTSVPPTLEPCGHRSRSAADHDGREDFAGLKPFAAGDSLRQVAWKVYARGGPLCSKRFTEAAGDVWHLEWSRTTGGTENRLSQLTRAVLEADAAGVDYVLVLPGETHGPAHGAAHRQACLAALALFGE